MPKDNIFQVVRSGDLDKLQLFVGQNRIQLNACDRNGQTALHIMASQGKLEEVTFLVESGAFVHVFDQAGRIPFHCAVENNHMEVANYLVQVGTFPHMSTRSEDTALHLSVENCLDEMTSWLIGTGANLQCKNRCGDTPLHIAARHGNVPVLRMMIKYNPDLEVLDIAGATPFFKAAAWGQMSAVQFLYDSGSNIHHINFKGDTTLHAAAHGGSHGVVKWLLLQGASITAENLCGSTPVDVARGNRLKELLRKVLSNGLGVIYNSPVKDSPEDLKLQQQEEANVKKMLKEEHKEETNMNARLLLEKELNLLNSESILQGKKTKRETRKGDSADQWSTYNGHLVAPDAESVNENEEESFLEALIAQHRPKIGNLDVRTALGSMMVPAPSSYASGVTDTAGTIGKSEDTLSDDTEFLNDSMLSQNSSEYWNERASFYLRRIQNMAKKIIEDLSSDDDSIESGSNHQTKPKSNPNARPAITKQQPKVRAKLAHRKKDKDLNVVNKQSAADESLVEDEEEYQCHDDCDELTQDFRGEDCTENLDFSDSDSDLDEVRMPELDMSMIPQVGARSDLEDNDVTELDRSDSLNNSGDILEETSLEKLIELQKEEMATLCKQQQQMLKDLRQSQQEEVDAEFKTLSQAEETGLDDVPESKINELKDALNSKHNAQLQQLWQDHQRAQNAMREAHKFDRMSLSYDSGNGENPSSDARKKVNTERDSILLQLGNLVRECELSPAVKTGADEFKEVRDKSGQSANKDDQSSALLEGLGKKVSVQSSQTKSSSDKSQSADKSFASPSAESPVNHMSKTLEPSKSPVVQSSSSPNKRRRDSRGKKMSISPKSCASSVQLLGKGKLAAGLGKSALATLLGDDSQSDTESDSMDTVSLLTNSTSSCFSEDDYDDDDDKYKSNDTVSNLADSQNNEQVNPVLANPTSSKHALTEDLVLETVTPSKSSDIIESETADNVSKHINDQTVNEKIAHNKSDSGHYHQNTKPLENRSSLIDSQVNGEKKEAQSKSPTKTRLSTGNEKESAISNPTKDRGQSLGSKHSNTPTNSTSPKARLSSASMQAAPNSVQNVKDDDATNTKNERKLSSQSAASEVDVAIEPLVQSETKSKVTSSAMDKNQALENNDHISKRAEKSEEQKTPTSEAKTRQRKRVSTGSRRESSSSATNQRLMATGQIAMGLGNTIMHSFMCNSDSDLSSHEDDISSRSRSSSWWSRDSYDDRSLSSRGAGSVTNSALVRNPPSHGNERSRSDMTKSDQNIMSSEYKVDIVYNVVPQMKSDVSHQIEQRETSPDNKQPIHHENSSKKLSSADTIHNNDNTTSGYKVETSLDISPRKTASPPDQVGDNRFDDISDVSTASVHMISSPSVRDNQVSSARFDDVDKLRNETGQAMENTVAMLKKVLEGGELGPTPEKRPPSVSMSIPNGDENSSRLSMNSNGRTRSPRPSITPRSSTSSIPINLSSYKALAKKLMLLASVLLTQSRAASLRNMSEEITTMVTEIEEMNEHKDDDLEWGASDGNNVKMRKIADACRNLKADALEIVRNEIQSLEERVRQIYNAFLD